jgi:hypothetical protein
MRIERRRLRGRRVRKQVLVDPQNLVASMHHHIGWIETHLLDDYYMYTRRIGRRLRRSGRRQASNYREDNS